MFQINGKEVYAALFDFAILMYHNAKKLHALGIGPYFYLPKVNFYFSFLFTIN